MLRPKKRVVRDRENWPTHARHCPSERQTGVGGPQKEEAGLRSSSSSSSTMDFLKYTQLGDVYLVREIFPEQCRFVIPRKKKTLVIHRLVNCTPRAAFCLVILA